MAFGLRMPPRPFDTSWLWVRNVCTACTAGLFARVELRKMAFNRRRRAFQRCLCGAACSRVEGSQLPSSSHKQELAVRAGRVACHSARVRRWRDEQVEVCLQG